MTIERIELNNYRNYTRAQVEPCPGITVFIGPNAQGKTNLLEAVYLCCTGRSHRTRVDRQLIRWESDRARVHIVCRRKDGPHEVEILLDPQEKKQVRVGGKSIARSGELMGHVNGVLFAPEDLRMVKDGPAERRRFLDMELSQISPAYYYNLQRYNRALKQRGALLRTGSASVAQLDVWDGQLCTWGAKIMLARRDFIIRLGERAGKIHDGISGGKEALRCEYKTQVAPDKPEDALRESLAEELLRAREEDLRRQISTVGPHHDDMVLKLNGTDVRAFGSQGQQRTCALSMKLSELQVMRDATGEYPVLMLDDVMSELDPERRRQLLGQLDGVQTMITCTDLEDLAGAPVGRRYRVENGSVREA